jgi:AAA ATPase domain
VDEPFVGRAAELAELGRQFALAAAGQGRVVVLAGPAGGGKTALIGRCLARWAGRAEALLVSGDEGEVALAGGLAAQLARPGPDAAADLAAVLADGRADPLSAGSAVLALLREQARAGPLVLVVDDVQWADELSLRALSFAVRRLAADPVLCLIAIRPDGLDRLPSGLVRVAAERGARLDLKGLDAGEVATLAELAGAGRLPDRAAERLREETGGIPLHIRELLHDLPGQALRVPGVAWPAPRSLQTLVVSRLAACTVDTEALVVAAAVLGAECELADAAALAGLADPLPALQEAVGQRLLTEPGAPGRRRCAFPHALIRAAVYQDIGASRRAALHRAAVGLTTGSTALAHRVAGCAGADGQLAADLAARADTERAAGQRRTRAGCSAGRTWPPCTPRPAAATGRPPAATPTRRPYSAAPGPSRWPTRGRRSPSRVMTFRPSWPPPRTRRPIRACCATWNRAGCPSGRSTPTRWPAAASTLRPPASCWWRGPPPPGSPTARSRPNCTSASRPSSFTSPRSWPASTSTRVPRSPAPSGRPARRHPRPRRRQRTLPAISALPRARGVAGSGKAGHGGGQQGAEFPAGFQLLLGRSAGHRDRGRTARHCKPVAIGRGCK